jgi:hypothetical protein
MGGLVSKTAADGPKGWPRLNRRIKVVSVTSPSNAPLDGRRVTKEMFALALTTSAETPTRRTGRLVLGGFLSVAMAVALPGIILGALLVVAAVSRLMRRRYQLNVIKAAALLSRPVGGESV